MKSYLVAIVLLVAVLALISLFFALWQPREDGSAETSVRSVVEEFGTQLKQVSLLAPEAAVRTAIEDAYRPYVTDELLAVWMRDPSSAPGRLTSSPWPDRIEIVTVTQAGGTYHVQGDVVLVASGAGGGLSDADRSAVTLTLVKEDGEWQIHTYEAAPSEGSRDGTVQYTHDDPVFSIAYTPEFHREQGAPSGRDDTFWSELATTSGETYVTLVLSDTYAPNTNLGSVRLTVGAATSTPFMECLNPSNGQEVARSEVTIGGLTFMKNSTVDAGAGNRYAVTSYRTVHKGACVALESVVHYTILENYPEGAVSAFDDAAIDALITASVMSFRLDS